MSTLREVLREGDPLADEVSIPAGRLRDMRQRVVTATRSTLDTPPPAARWQRRAFLVGAAAVVVTAGLAWRFSSQAGVALQAAVRFEVRLAEDHPEPGLTEARVGRTDRVVYLYRDVVVSNADIAATHVVARDAPGRFGVVVDLNDAGAKRMEASTAAHLDKPLAIVLDGSVAMAPIIRSPIGGTALISGSYTRTEADRLAEGMARQ